MEVFQNVLDRVEKDEVVVQFFGKGGEFRIAQRVRNAYEHVAAVFLAGIVGAEDADHLAPVFPDDIGHFLDGARLVGQIEGVLRAPTVNAGDAGRS